MKTLDANGTHLGRVGLLLLSTKGVELALALDVLGKHVLVGVTGPALLDHLVGGLTVLDIGHFVEEKVRRNNVSSERSLQDEGFEHGDEGGGISEGRTYNQQSFAAGSRRNQVLGQVTTWGFNQWAIWKDILARNPFLSACRSMQQAPLCLLPISLALASAVLVKISTAFSRVSKHPVSWSALCSTEGLPQVILEQDCQRITTVHRSVVKFWGERAYEEEEDDEEDMIEINLGDELVLGA